MQMTTERSASTTTILNARSALHIHRNWFRNDADKQPKQRTKKSIYLHTFIYSCSVRFFLCVLCCSLVRSVLFFHFHMFKYKIFMCLFRSIIWILLLLSLSSSSSSFFPSVFFVAFIIFNLFIVFSNYEYGGVCTIFFVFFFLFIVQHNNVVSVLRPHRVHRMLDLEQNETKQNEIKSAHSKTLAKRDFGFVWPLGRCA